MSYVMIFGYADEDYHPWAFLVPDNVDRLTFAQAIESASNTEPNISSIVRVALHYGATPIECFDATMRLLKEDQPKMVTKLTDW